MKKFDRATRRRYNANIKRKIWKAIDYHASRATPSFIDKYYSHLVKYFFKNGLKCTKERRFCECEWCLENWTFSKKKEDHRCEQEIKDYFDL